MTWQRWAIRVLKWAVGIELAWLLLINAALSLDLTQDLLNRIKPEKFNIRWDRAWSWFPGQVSVQGGFANGQSRRQQWQFSADSVSGRIALLPLALRRVNVQWAEGQDVDFRMRPRLREERDFTPMVPDFPDIEGRDVVDVDPTPLPERRPWHVTLDDIVVSGNHSVWIYNLRGAFEGHIEGDLTVRSRGGPLWMDLHTVDLALAPFTVGGDEEIFQQARLTGQVGFDTFVPRENRGAAMLRYARADVQVDVDMNSLAFINLFTLNFEGLSFDGRGHVEGRLNVAAGEVLDGTDLHIDADDLLARVVDLDISGSGDVALRRHADTDDEMLLALDFADLEVRHAEDDLPLLTGRDLALRIGGDGDIVPEKDHVNPTRTLSARLERLAVPDLALLQRYLPAKWPFQLLGGSGWLEGSASLAPNRLDVDLRLSSEAATTAIKDYVFDTHLDGRLRLLNEEVHRLPTTLDGTFIAIEKARLRRQDGDDGEEWSASFRIPQGELRLIPAGNRHAHVLDVLKVLGKTSVSDMLGSTRGELTLEAELSSLAWLDALTRGRYQTRFEGTGKLRGDLALVDGLPAVGTAIGVAAEHLQLNYLDYVSRGEGDIRLEVLEGGAAPDWRLAMQLGNADMRRRGEAEAGIRNVVLDLEALLEDVELGREETDFSLRFRIRSAEVTDMRVFNGYFPDDSILQFDAGTANLSADILLQREDADGWLRLQGNDLEALLDGQRIAGNLDLDLQLVGGRPDDMHFDAAGSTLTLDGVRIVGQKSTFDEDAWAAQIRLDQALATWRAPVSLDARISMGMSDTRPFVALFQNQGTPGWMAGMLNTDDVSGSGQVLLSEQRLRVPGAIVVSDDLEVGLKGLFSSLGRDAHLFLRYRKLTALLKIAGDKRNLDLFNARKTFDEWVLPEVPTPMTTEPDAPPPRSD